MSFTSRPYFITHHTSAVVTALYVNICFGCNDMAKLRCYFICNINSLRIRIVPQQRHTRAIFNRLQINPIDLHLR